MSGFALRSACWNLHHEVEEAQTHFKIKDPIFNGTLSFLNSYTWLLSGHENRVFLHADFNNKMWRASSPEGSFTPKLQTGLKGDYVLNFGR